MAKRQQCELCGEDIESCDTHDIVVCEKTELLKGRIEIKILKDRVKSWQDSWYDLRKIVGNLWWHHPSIADDKVRDYYKNNLNQLQSALKEQETNNVE